MIIEKLPLAMADVKERVDKLEDKEELKKFLKKFTKLDKEKSDKLISDLRELDNFKLNEVSYVKIADFVPRTKEELNKILQDVSLNEEEVNAILEVVGRY